MMNCDSSQPPSPGKRFSFLGFALECCFCGFLCLFAAILCSPRLARAEDLTADFDAANKLYEQGKYREAATAFENLELRSPRSDTLRFNLGNAWFKAGQTGRAIAAWREAEHLSPRDPSVSFNLQFARKQVSGSEASAGPLWQRGLCALTLNEWAVLASITLWVWFLLLALREWRPALRTALSGYTATVGVVLLALGVCLGAATNLQLNALSAVVIVPEAIARSGPLDEAKVLHQFRDGTELIVLDRKEITGDAKQSWLQVRDATARSGWVRSDNLIALGARSK